MSDFEISGADQFYRLSKALKQAGRTAMRNELNAAMRRAATPLVKVAKTAAKDVFPRAGGMDEREAKIPFRAVTRTGRDNHGVQVVAPGKWVAAKTTNATGKFRHPVLPKRTKTGKVDPAERKTWHWVDQEIPGSTGWFDKAMEGSASTVLPELEKALDNVIDEIVKEAR